MIYGYVKGQIDKIANRNRYSEEFPKKIQFNIDEMSKLVKEIDEIKSKDCILSYDEKTTHIEKLKLKIEHLKCLNMQLISAL